jgi:RNA polymerase sigma-70 factor (ECF subfamily)
MQLQADKRSTLTSLIGIVGNKNQEIRGRTVVEWARLVQNIRTGDEAALEELYRICRTFPAHLLTKSLPPCDVEDAIHNLYLVGLGQIRRGDLKEPSKLVAYLIIMARRLVCHWIAGRARSPYQPTEPSLGEGGDWQSSAERLVSHYPGPDRRYLQTQRMDIAARVLGQLSKREREILNRFYVLEQSAEEIQQGMNLTSTQFRLAKSRAKAKAVVIAATVLKPRLLRRQSLTVARTLAVA